MEGVGLLFVHLVYFMAIWYFLWPLGKFYGFWVDLFPVLVCFTMKNLATLILTLVARCRTLLHDAKFMCHVHK
jgi:hypothetical protein